ncbi:MAG: hypothetical protein WBG94_17550 [Anaerolineales bacterium]
MNKLMFPKRQRSKNIMKQYKMMVLIIFVLVLSSLACNLGFGKPATPEFELPVITQALDNSANNLAGPGLDTEIQGIPHLEITENQLASLMEDELEQRVGDQITNLQVYLQNGQIQILGDLNTQGISAPAKVVFDVSIDPVGRPILSIISSSIGPFPIPGDLVAEVEVLINKAFQEKVLTLAPNMHIDNIVIQEGIMTIYGHSK